MHVQIMPFLAAVLGRAWDGLWAGYASMVTIELYNSSVTNDFYIRLTYNGEVLLIPGCSEHLCNATKLLEALAFGEKSMPCSMATSTTSEATTMCSSSTTTTLDTSDWIGICVGSGFMGVLVGAALIVFLYKRKVESGSMTVYNTNDSNVQNSQFMDSPMTRAVSIDRKATTIGI